MRMPICSSRSSIVSQTILRSTLFCNYSTTIKPIKNIDRFMKDLKNDQSDINQLINSNKEKHETTTTTTKTTLESSSAAAAAGGGGAMNSKHKNILKRLEKKEPIQFNKRSSTNTTTTSSQRSTPIEKTTEQEEEELLTTTAAAENVMIENESRQKRDDVKRERERQREQDPRYYQEIAPGIAINPQLSKLDKKRVCVSSTDHWQEAQDHAQKIATQLDLDYLEWKSLEVLPTDLCSYMVVLFVTKDGEISLNDLEMFENKKGRVKRKMTCAVSLDYTTGELAFKTLKKTYARSPLVLSVTSGKSSSSSEPLNVLDITGGLGKDSWILASFGCKVTILERNPLLNFMMERALEKAKASSSTGGEGNALFSEIANRITLVKTDSIEYLVKKITDADGLNQDRPDVIYMDPMYQTKENEDNNKALSKKDIRAIRKLVGGDRESKVLFALSKRLATKKIVWKKPKNLGAHLGVDSHYRSTDTRFDVFLMNKNNNNNNSDDVLNNNIQEEK
ncbi:hypothetical protein DFA_06585 [Cavenderia fasciculata]|uniref:SAM-dependent methyltransferase n=1 Tax=Cavenderia fasciculata TaxID=261658 RepID=F4PJE9_CACFS|nr:uncharacterized protein DFA_06585 [Cavenderia fasciculata]EGG24435.1 hypothetical protein DFA_06585 [Cavenderia fasciculata]|eukprot:XP_004362286.1 hypothetical protein DFA_06585 [Cavenderia fasciculata]